MNQVPEGHERVHDLFGPSFKISWAFFMLDDLECNCKGHDREAEEPEGPDHESTLIPS